MSARELPRDVDALIALVHSEREKVAERDAKIAANEEKLAALEHMLALYEKWRWGPRSEKSTPAVILPAGQSWLPFADLLDAVQRIADQHGAHGTLVVEQPKEVAASTHGKRRADFPEHLPRVRTTIEAPEADRICCKQPMEAMGFEETKELERIEIAVVHVIARTKYCCRVCQMHVLTAPGPTRPIPKGLLGSNWLAQLAVERFGNHMPYHRLEQKYASEGLSLSRTVLCRSLIEVSERGLDKVHAALGVEVATGDVAFADETPTPVQESKKGGPKRAWVWAYANKDGDRFFDYSESRGRDSPQRILGKFVGYLHDDGYCVYKSAFDPAKVVHVACWAHARRKFVDASKKEPAFAKEAVDQIARLYAIDSEAEKRGLSCDERFALRNELAPKILTDFKAWLDVRQTQVLPKSGLGQAIRYALGRWDALGRFLEDGRLELDNNRAERTLRAFAIGRKNWMQIGNERGGKTAAIYFSLIGTCKARGIDPKIYLHDVMLRLAEGADAKTLTPKEWQARHASEVAERRNYVLAKIVAKLAEAPK